MSSEQSTQGQAANTPAEMESLDFDSDSLASNDCTAEVSVASVSAPVPVHDTPSSGKREGEGEGEGASWHWVPASEEIILGFYLYRDCKSNIRDQLKKGCIFRREREHKCLTNLTCYQATRFQADPPLEHLWLGTPLGRGNIHNRDNVDWYRVTNAGRRSLLATIKTRSEGVGSLTDRLISQVSYKTIFNPLVEAHLGRTPTGEDRSPAIIHDGSPFAGINALQDSLTSLFRGWFYRDDRELSGMALPLFIREMPDEPDSMLVLAKHRATMLWKDISGLCTRVEVVGCPEKLPGLLSVNLIKHIPEGFRQASLGKTLCEVEALFPYSTRMGIVGHQIGAFDPSDCLDFSRIEPMTFWSLLRDQTGLRIECINDATLAVVERVQVCKVSRTCRGAAFLSWVQPYPSRKDTLGT